MPTGSWRHPRQKQLVAALAVVVVLAGGGTAGALAVGGGSHQSSGPSVSTTAQRSPGWFVAPALGSLQHTGTITAAQASALSQRLAAYMGSHRLAYGPGQVAQALGPRGPLAVALGQCVADGTFSQAQAAAIGQSVAQRYNARWQPATAPNSAQTTEPTAPSTSPDTQGQSPQGTVGPRWSPGDSPDQGPGGYGPGMMGGPNGAPYGPMGGPGD